MMPRALSAVALCLALLAPAAPRAQDLGAASLAELVAGLGTSARVLVIAAHPDDEDTGLLTWLARGRHAEVAYLSLTRGDGGQNLIGNELGEALGVIRTEELLAARRIDGARQYFTRAYDFGFSKSAAETFTHWPRDSILRDVIAVVRDFRPHVIVSIFTGTDRDGHGQHQVAGILARDAYDLAGDTVRFPRTIDPARHGGWTPLKFYRSSRFAPDAATLRFNIGELSPLRGRSYAEIAAESRSQHRSQGFGTIQRRGVVWGYLRLEHSRVAPRGGGSDRSIFDGIDTTWTRLRPLARDAAARAAIDSLPGAAEAARLALNVFDPASVIPDLARVKRLMHTAWCGGARNPCRYDDVDPMPSGLPPELERSLADGLLRVDGALLRAAGIAMEALVEREVVAVLDSVRVEVTVYNRGRVPIRTGGVYQIGPGARPVAIPVTRTLPLAADSARRWTFQLDGQHATQPHWLVRPRRGGMFSPLAGAIEEGTGLTAPTDAAHVHAVVEIADARVWVRAPVVHRVGDPVRGDVRRPLAVAPGVSVSLEREVEYAAAGERLDRTIRVHLRSAWTTERPVRLTLTLPRGLRADSAERALLLGGGESRTVDIRVTGTLPAGRHEITALVESGAERFESGYALVDHPHVRPRRLYRRAILALEAVDARVPAGLAVGYIAGVGDNVAPALRQLGFAVTLLEPAELDRVDLGAFGAVVVGPRAYEAHPSLVRHNDRLLEYARSGGTLVVQYGQYEMQRPGIMPFPVELSRPHARVTREDAPVRILRGADPVLTTPNRIGARDFEGWVQERALYMPVGFAPEYRPLLAMSDPGEPARESAVLVARYGVGTYVYTTLAFFRQLPAGVPGAARLFVNLLAAGGAHAAAPPVAPPVAP